MREGIRWRAHARVDKYEGDRLIETVECPGNLLTTAGLDRLTSLIIGAGGQAATATAARLGVGDGSTAADVSDTDLGATAGATHRQFKTLDSVDQADGVMTFVATFGTGVANFAWDEWCVDIGTPTVADGTTVNACMVNHKTSAGLGTKTSSGTWVLTATITLS